MTRSLSTHVATLGLSEIYVSLPNKQCIAIDEIHGTGQRNLVSLSGSLRVGTRLRTFVRAFFAVTIFTIAISRICSENLSLQFYCTTNIFTITVASVRWCDKPYYLRS
jgi:hypothetical protein